MKKICYVVTLPGTIKAFFVPQLKYLSENGFDVSVICNDDKELMNELGSKIKFIPVEIPRGISFFKSIKAIKNLKKVFAKEHYDLIQYSTPNAALYSAIAAKSINCQIRNYHCMGFRYLGFSGIPKIIFKVIEKLTCSLSTHIECVSPSNLELGVSEKIFNREKAMVVFHGSTGGVDLKRFNFDYRNKWREELRNKYDIHENDFVYGFIGRITRDKGINELLHAFFSLDNNCKLLLIGKIEDESHIDPSLLNMAEISCNVIFTGEVADVEKYFATIDVLILPSYREGFGNVVIEAEAMGTPVIVSDIPGPIDAMKDKVTGMIVPVKDVLELKKAMNSIKLEIFEKNYTNRCHEFIKESFDSVLLCKQILKRKKYLLEKYNE